MKVGVIGDSCIDLYRDTGRYYLTGNIIDTGIHLCQLGVDVSVLTYVGDDAYGREMIEALNEEGLDVSHVRQSSKPTAVTYMELNGNERVHGEYVEGAMEDLVFDEEDILFVSGMDLVHSALWGKSESYIPGLKKSGSLISFDFADRLEHPLVETLEKYTDIGFFSHTKRDSYIEEYLTDRINGGMRLAIATLGANGSLCRDEQGFYYSAAIESEVVNTVGAGDSFIAGFLFEYLRGKDVRSAMLSGAKRASKVIGMFEPWEPCRISTGKL